MVKLKIIDLTTLKENNLITHRLDNIVSKVERFINKPNIKVINQVAVNSYLLLYYKEVETKKTLKG